MAVTFDNLLTPSPPLPAEFAGLSFRRSYAADRNNIERFLIDSFEYYDPGPDWTDPHAQAAPPAPPIKQPWQTWKSWVAGLSLSFTFLGSSVTLLSLSARFNFELSQWACAIVGQYRESVYPIYQRLADVLPFTLNDPMKDLITAIFLAVSAANIESVWREKRPLVLTALLSLTRAAHIEEETHDPPQVGIFTDPRREMERLKRDGFLGYTKRKELEAKIEALEKGPPRSTIKGEPSDMYAARLHAWFRHLTTGLGILWLFTCIWLWLRLDFTNFGNVFGAIPSWLNYWLGWFPLSIILLVTTSRLPRYEWRSAASIRWGDGWTRVNSRLFLVLLFLGFVAGFPYWVLYLFFIGVGVTLLCGLAVFSAWRSALVVTVFFAILLLANALTGEASRALTP